MQKVGIEFLKLNVESLEELVQISKSTYSDAFSNENTVENMQSYLDKSFNQTALEKQLTTSKSAFYFAKRNNQTLGYLKINSEEAQTGLKEENGLEVERIYVLQEFQKQKVGKALMDFAITMARNQEKEYVWLGVWEKNKKAIAFYEKLGFKIIGTHPFTMGKEVQTDYIMKMSL